MGSPDDGSEPPQAEEGEQMQGDHPTQPMFAAVPPAIAVLEDDDNDSTFGGSIGNRTETTSLAASIFNYRRENGRTYHSYRAGGQ